MKAIGIERALPAQDPNAFVERDVPVPTPDAQDLLVHVQAISVNPADYRQRKRKEDDGNFAVLGWDVAGEVVGMGPDAVGFQTGDKVYYAGDLNRPGANSEYHVVDAALVGHQPTALSASAAAALPLTALTAWEALFERLGLSPQHSADGRVLLIVGGAGGVGSMAIQLARLVPGLTVIATASRPDSRAWCENMGAHAVIDHFQDMGAQIAALGLPAPDLVLMANDPDRHFANLAALIASQGALCSIVPFQHPADMNLLMRKSVRFVWEFMFTRSMFATSDRGRQGQILNKVAALIDQRRLRSTTGELLGPITAANLGLAHARLEQGRTIGKLVLAGF